MALAARFTRSLIVSFDPSVVDAAGWQAGDVLGLQWRREGALLRLRLGPASNGWRLVCAKVRGGVVWRVQCLPPPPMEHREAPGMSCAWQRDGRALLLDVPWDLGVEDSDEAAS